MPGLWYPSFRNARGDLEEPFEIEDVGCIKDSGKALLCHLPDGADEWFPYTQISIDSEVQQEDDVGTLIISSWLARKKDLLEEDYGRHDYHH